MRKIYLTFIAVVYISFYQLAFGQINLTSVNGTYSENFDGMGASGTSFQNGWTAIRIAGSGTLNATLSPVVDNGSSNSGNPYNIGTTGATDRALGTLASGSTVPAFGASFKNNTSTSITALSLSGYSEQWRTGSNAINEAVVFEYSLDATSLSSGTWVAVSSLNLVELQTGSTSASAIDGNATTNRLNISGSISSISIPVGATFWIRWKDSDAVGSDGNYAIDDFELNYTNEAGSNSVSLTGSMNANESGSNGSFSISFTPTTDDVSSIDYAFTGTATFGTDYTVSFSAGTPNTTIATGRLEDIPASTNSIIVTIIPADDADIEGNENIILTISEPTGGYSIGTASASFNIIDNDVAPTVSVAAGVNAAEPSTNGSFGISLSSPAPTGGVTINYSLSGTAILSTDYNDLQNGSIIIPEGSTIGSITLNVTDDAIAELSETISIALNSATNGFTIANANASINLLDNDIAPISIIAIQTPVTEDFNTLANSGSSSLLPSGWSLSESGTAANATYSTSTGSANGGDTYSFGVASNSERAFGSLQSGSVTATIGAYYANNTGATITSLKVNYTGEQWRLGAAGREDRLNFQYSLNANSLITGTWTDFDNLDFIAPISAGTLGALDGNASTNKTAISYTISGLSIPNGSNFFIRWSDFGASGADDGLAVDDFSIEANPIDNTPPAFTLLNPANATTDVTNNVTAIITFNEEIVKGTGNILIKKANDNSIVQTIDATTSAISITSTAASFSITGLELSTSYYIEIDNTVFKDLSSNSFAGISGSTTWGFTTAATATTGVLDKLYNFNTCGSILPDGFSQYSVTGDQKWACTTFGIDATHSQTGSAANGLQMNGFSSVNIENEDWLISPSFDLNSTSFPLLEFWSRTAFSGKLLALKVSTDYPGAGNPKNYTWVDLNGKFPSPVSNVWTLSSNINLSAYKAASVYVAFVYNSTSDDGARWTLDEFKITNSPTPARVSISLSTNTVQFGYAAAGSSIDKSFVVTGNDIIGDISLTASSFYSLSTNSGGPFTSSISLAQATANNTPTTIYVRFTPDADNQNFSGTATIRTNGLADTAVSLKGTSISVENTLEIVNWNVEWFGHSSLGPTNNDLQQTNVQTILQSIGADLYALAEIIDVSRLQAIVNNMPGYAYVICDYGSHTNPFEPGAGPQSQAQKEAFIYKTSVFTNISTSALATNGVNTAADLNNPAYNYFSSGRYPFMMKADVSLNGTLSTVRFVLLHAKANTAPTDISYNRRKAGADTLKYIFDNVYPNDKIILLGDINDDLDRTITDGINPPVTSYSAFVGNAFASGRSTGTSFTSPTLALSLAGKKSTVSYNDVIDHVLLSDEIAATYMESTANILTDAASLVSNYASTTSDHYPVFSRYLFNASTLPVGLISFDAVKDAAKASLAWKTAQESDSKEFIIERSSDGNSFHAIGTVRAAGNSTSTNTYGWVDAQPLNGNNFYRLKSVDLDDKFSISKTLKLFFDETIRIQLRPNPASSFVNVFFKGVNNSIAVIEISNLAGQSQKKQTSIISENQPVQVSLSGLPKAVYLIKVSTDKFSKTEKLLIY